MFTFIASFFLLWFAFIQCRQKQLTLFRGELQSQFLCLLLRQSFDDSVRRDWSFHRRELFIQDVNDAWRERRGAISRQCIIAIRITWLFNVELCDVSRKKSSPTKGCHRHAHLVKIQKFGRFKQEAIYSSNRGISSALSCEESLLKIICNKLMSAEKGSRTWW